MPEVCHHLKMMVQQYMRRHVNYDDDMNEVEVVNDVRKIKNVIDDSIDLKVDANIDVHIVHALNPMILLVHCIHVFNKLFYVSVTQSTQQHYRHRSRDRDHKRQSKVI